MADPISWHRDGFTVSTDPAQVSIDVVHDFLCNESYWAKGIPRETVERSIKGSMPFVLLHGEKQVGFARVTSDFATVAYLGDVFVLPDYRGKGLSKWLMECITGHPDLQGLRRWMLATADAHGLYAQFGFTPLKAPPRWMEKHNPDVYPRRG